MTKEEQIMNTIGKNIRKYRLIFSANHFKLTQKDLADKVGVSTSLIGALESSKTIQGIGVYNLYKISEVLEVDINRFFE